MEMRLLGVGRDRCPRRALASSLSVWTTIVVFIKRERKGGYVLWRYGKVWWKVLSQHVPMLRRPFPLRD